MMVVLRPLDEDWIVKPPVMTWAGGVLLLVQGCSTQSMQRTGFETLHNVGEQQCLNREMRQCPDNPTYEEYQEQRRELEASE